MYAEQADDTIRFVPLSSPLRLMQKGKLFRLWDPSDVDDINVPLLSEKGHFIGWDVPPASSNIYCKRAEVFLYVPGLTTIRFGRARCLRVEGHRKECCTVCDFLP
jgi:hypothetical protein